MEMTVRVLGKPAETSGICDCSVWQKISWEATETGAGRDWSLLQINKAFLRRVQNCGKQEMRKLKLKIHGEISSVHFPIWGIKWSCALKQRTSCPGSSGTKSVFLWNWALIFSQTSGSFLPGIPLPFFWILKGSQGTGGFLVDVYESGSLGWPGRTQGTSTELPHVLWVTSYI